MFEFGGYKRPELGRHPELDIPAIVAEMEPIAEQAYFFVHDGKIDSFHENEDVREPGTNGRRKRRRQDLHFLNEDGMVACNPRDREAAHRAEVEGIATRNPQAVTCKKCRAVVKEKGITEAEGMCTKMGYKLLSRVLFCFFLCLTAHAQPVRVMTVVMSEWNEDPQEWVFEGSLWVKGENLIKQIDVPGIRLPVVCNDGGHCIVVVGEGSDNAAASIMALGLFLGFDLTKTYFLIAGIAGTTPNVGTVGSVAWAEWVVSSDSTAEIDRRELPEEWRFDRFRLGCEVPWCDTFGSESGFHHLKPTLTDLAFGLSEDVALLDTQEARESRKRFSQDLAASRPPSVLKCDTLAGDSYWHGRLLSEWAEWWVKKWTGGKGRYCMTNQEDFGTLTAFKRLSDEGRVDWARIMVLHAASNLDQPNPGQSAIDSLNHFDTHGLNLALENAYRAGSVVVKHILGHWDEWEHGVSLRTKTPR